MPSTTTSLVMTILGPDRPGVVESLAQAVAANSGNWVESRMAHLAGQFAGIVRVDVPSAQATSLRKALEKLDLKIAIVEDEAPAIPPARLVRLQLIGPDRPGIIRELSHALAVHGINVEELETECTSAPMSGEALFKADAWLSLPEHTAMDRVWADLETIANELTVEIDLIDKKEHV